MNKISLAAAVALVAALPLSAQETMPPQSSTIATPTMTQDQQSDYDSWPPDRRTMYDGWPATLQVYYWTLDPAQRNGWWALNDDQRAQIYAMPPERQAQVWASIDQQMRGVAPPSAATTSPPGATTSATAQTTVTRAAPASPATPASPSGRIEWTSSEVVQPVQPPRQGEYPVCKGDADDQCINPWEAGQRGPNVNRPLAYWPGKPASDPR